MLLIKTTAFPAIGITPNCTIIAWPFKKAGVQFGMNFPAEDFSI
jgi:hypothetical protein